MRIILSLLGLWHGANGVVMLAAPAFWYGAVPGVAETGAANAHFIRDIGLGFLAAGLALLLAARSENPRALIMIALTFLGGHSLLHVVEYLHDRPDLSVVIRDVLTIHVMSLLPALFLRRPAMRGLT